MALAGGVAVCAGFVIVAGGFVIVAGGFVPGAGLFVIVGACFVIGGRVAGQGRRQAVFIQRAGVFCEVNQGHFRRRGYELIIFAVFVVQIGHAVIPRNIPVLGLGGLHALLCLRFGQAVEQQAGTVGKLGNKTVRRLKRHVFVIHALHPFVLYFVLGLLYHAMPRR